MPEDPVPPDAGGQRAFRFEHEGYSGLQPFHDVRAAGPGPDAEALRIANLDLLKLSLCDLTGASTVSVWKDAGRGMMSRELRGDDLQVRALGVDWPLEGLTMVGLNRLDDVQSCVESAVADGVEGDLIEAGTWRGGASILMRATLDTLGERDRAVVVADSFAGFPEANDEHPETRDLAEMDYIAVPLEEVQANFARFGLDHGVEFVPGFFSSTMPALQGRSWSVMRLDGDSYEATSITLRALYPGLAVGGYVLIDDYSLAPCQKAVEEFRERHGITEPIEQVDWTSVRWRRSDPTPIAEPELPPAASNSTAPAAGDKPKAHVPDVHEVTLREQLAERERELQELRGQLGLRDWLRRKLSVGGA